MAVSIRLALLFRQPAFDYQPELVRKGCLFSVTLNLGTRGVKVYRELGRRWRKGGCSAKSLWNIAERLMILKGNPFSVRLSKPRFLLHPAQMPKKVTQLYVKCLRHGQMRNQILAPSEENVKKMQMWIENWIIWTRRITNYDGDAAADHLNAQ
jgi:hypothetical protein